MKGKEESENFGLKLNIQKIKIMASSSITLWQIDGEKVETVADFIFGGSKITSDGYCCHEIKKKHLLLGRNLMTNWDSILKSRNITLPTKVPLVKAIYSFSSIHVWMWESDCKKAKCRIIDAFQLWYWRRFSLFFFHLFLLEYSWGSLGLQGDQTSPH